MYGSLAIGKWSCGRLPAPGIYRFTRPMNLVCPVSILPLNLSISNPCAAFDVSIENLKPMKKFLLLLSVVAVIGTITAFSNYLVNDYAEEKAISEMLERSYIHGAFNELNPQAMAEGFHKDFAIFRTDGPELTRYEIADWVKNVENKKNAADFDPAKNIWEHKFEYIDVSGESAAVKVQLYHEGKHVFTDYLSLLKFPDGWKVVAKVYTRYE